MGYFAKAFIDTDALLHNFQQVKSYAPHSKILAMIKADGYGHGLLPVAHSLQPADAFGLARLDEAITLREAGVTQTLVLMEGFLDQSDLRLIQQYQLDVVLHSSYQLDLLENNPLNFKLSVWVKIDTGMHRLGFAPEKITEIVTRLQRCSWVAPTIRFLTHFASAECLMDETTSQQINTFYECLLPFSYEKSLANSAAIMQWPQSHADWVRPGIMLYGVSPFPDKTAQECGLEPVMTLQAEIIAIHNLKQGDRVGYNGTWVCPENMPIGVIAIGYGDGYPRCAPNNTPILIHDIRVPLAGRVSMDMITVDLRGIPNVSCGDVATLWGKGLPIEEIAIWTNSSAYELLTNVTSRVKKIYG